MAYSIEFVGDVLWLTFTEKVTSEDLQSVAETLGRMESEPDVCPHRISDFSGTDGVELSFAAVHQCASIRRQVRLRNPVKSALIAPSPVQFGFARMFQTLNDNPSIEVRLFAAKCDAVAWISEDAMQE
jgi:hypothetical protein